MGDRGDVDDFGHFDTSTMNGANSRFASVSGSFDIRLDLSQAKIECDFGTILSGHLGCIGGVLLRTTESHLAGRRPGDDLPVAIGEGYNDVVEGRVDVCLSDCIYFYVSLFSCDCFLCHISS